MVETVAVERVVLVPTSDVTVLDLEISDDEHPLTTTQATTKTPTTRPILTTADYLATNPASAHMT